MPYLFWSGIAGVLAYVAKPVENTVTETSKTVKTLSYVFALYIIFQFLKSTKIITK